MQILMIGRNDPAGMMITFANAINRYSEHCARVVALETRYQMDYEYDLLLPFVRDEDYGEIEHLLRTSDVFHFHMLCDEHMMIGPLCVRDYLPGKKVLHHHHGHPDFLITADSYREKYRSLNRKAVVSTPDLLQLIPEATWQPNMVPLFEADFLPRGDHLSKQDRIKIAQAPTRKWHKHTAEFLRVCDRLKREHSNVEALILEGKSYRECLKIKRDCHMVFDHMNGWMGISSFESLAHGIPVFAGLDDWNIKCVREFTGTEFIPWVLVRNEDELYEEFAKHVRDPELRVETGRQGREFMESYWTEQQALSVLLSTYEAL